MHFHGIPTERSTMTASAHRQDHSHRGHAPRWRGALSRRQFAATAAGAAVVGATLGAGVWRPRLTQARQSPEPIPIPGSLGSRTIVHARCQRYDALSHP
jgi:hypothetical protein